MKNMVSISDSVANPREEEVNLSAYVFFRRNKASEHVPQVVPPSRLSAKEVRTLLFASGHKQPDRAIGRMVEGKQVRTIYGTYWAEKKRV